MEKLSTDELVRLAGIMAQDVISELAVADAAITLMMHGDTVPLEIRGKLSLLTKQVRGAAVPAKQFIMRSRAQGYVRVVDLNQFFSDLSQLSQRLLSQNIDFRTDIPVDLWPTQVNIGHFEDAFISLVIRARGAMPNGGTLLIRAANVDKQTSQSMGGLCGDHVLIEITDNGVGIPPTDLKHIFDPFFITNSPVSGFDLAKAYSAIANTGGRLCVKSEVGKGTTFSALVPRHLPGGQAKLTIG